MSRTMSLASMDRKQKQTDVNDEGKKKEGQNEINEKTGKFFLIFSMTLKTHKKNRKKKTTSK